MDMWRASTRVVPVSMSLITGNGQCAVVDDERQVRELELDVRDVRRVEQWVASGAIPRVSDADDSRASRPVYLLIDDEESLIAPFALEPRSPKDGAHLTYQPGWREETHEAWVGAMGAVSRLARAAVERDEILDLEAPEHDFMVRIRQVPGIDGESRLAVAASREISGHEVWRRAQEWQGGFALVAPCTDEMTQATGQLCQLAFEEVGAHPLDVFPTYLDPSPAADVTPDGAVAQTEELRVRESEQPMAAPTQVARRPFIVGVASDIWETGDATEPFPVGV